MKGREVKLRLAEYTMWSHGQQTGRRMVNGESPDPFGCECARKLGLTAGRGNSLAAHLLGVVICFGISLCSVNTQKASWNVSGMGWQLMTEPFLYNTLLTAQLIFQIIMTKFWLHIDDPRVLNQLQMIVNLPSSNSKRAIDNLFSDSKDNLSY
jgi:hypothetical protein